MIPAQKEAGVMEAYLFSDTKAESQWLIKQIQTFIQKMGNIRNQSYYTDQLHKRSSLSNLC